MTENLKIKVSEVTPVISSFWGWKEGGNVKSIKKRWFVLTTNKMYYFANENASEAKGCITITKTTKLIEKPELDIPHEKYFVSIEGTTAKFVSLRFS